MIGQVDNGLEFLQQALRLRDARQEVLAGNIANADTPGYKARDFDFAAALNAATGGGQAPVALAVTNPGHQRLAGDNGLYTLFQRAAVQPSLDGNTVDTNMEQAKFSDNAIHYEALLTFMNMKFKSLQSAVQG